MRESLSASFHACGLTIAPLAVQSLLAQINEKGCKVDVMV